MSSNSSATASPARRARAVSLDASAGVGVFRSRACTVHVQADVRNLSGRLRVINFAGLFSGTALGPPRSAAVRARVEF